MNQICLSSHLPKHSHGVSDKHRFRGVVIVDGADGYSACFRDASDAEICWSRLENQFVRCLEDEVFRNDGFVSHASPLCPLAFVFVRFVVRMNYTNARDLFAHDCRMLAAVENIL